MNDSSCQLLDLYSTRSSHGDAGGRTGNRGRKVDRKGLDGGRNRDGGSEAGKEGGSETDRTKEKGKEGGREAGRKKEERVGPSNEAEE